MHICSPITKTANVSVERTMRTDLLVSEYKRIFDVDITHLVGTHQEITLLKCNDSGFRFYYPFDIVGDSDFYHQLESREWYYMPTKWEFEESVKHIQGGTVLDIGSGRGDFLALVLKSYPDVQAVGLELNQEAARSAQARGINVLAESSTEHTRSNRERYDVVATFQLLEHISTPIELLEEAIYMLKPGGKLIIGVPDNSQRAFPSIFVRPDNIMNMPPHHQGLWDIASLSYLPRILPIKLDYVGVEPATASHHSNSYRGLMKQDLMKRFGPYLGFAIYATGRPFYDHALKWLNKYLPAHSVLAIFNKVNS